MNDKVVVSHKENGKWVEDGEFTQAEAKRFVERCEYDTHKVEYKIEAVSTKKAKKEPELKEESDTYEISD